MGKHANRVPGNVRDLHEFEHFLGDLCCPIHRVRAARHQVDVFIGQQAFEHLCLDADAACDDFVALAVLAVEKDRTAAGLQLSREALEEGTHPVQPALG